MLEHITWNNYLLATAVLTMAYYFVVGALYYRNEISRLIDQAARSRANYRQAEKETSQADPHPITEKLENVVSRIDNTLEHAGTGMDKASLLRRITEVLTDYDDLHRPAFRVALKNHIIEKAMALCGIAISDPELEEAWQGQDDHSTELS